MKLRKEYIFLGIIIILLASYLVFNDANRSQKGIPQLAKVAGKDITRVEITKGQEKITLHRKDQEWTLGEDAWPADSMKVNSMLGAIAELRLSALVSTAKVYERYDLGDDKKIGVIAWAGNKEVRRFDVGKVGDTYQQTFVKLPNDENVYQAIKNLRETFESKIDDLLDKKVMAIASESIKEITFTGPKKTAVFTRKEVPVEEKKTEDETKGQESKDSAAEKGDKPKPESKMTTVWQDADGKSADPEVIGGILNKFSSLHCDSFIKGKKKEDFSSPLSTIRLVSDKTHILSVFEKNKKEDNYPAVSSENAYPFVLSAQTVEAIQKEFDALIGK